MEKHQKDINKIYNKILEDNFEEKINFSKKITRVRKKTPISSAYPQQMHDMARAKKEYAKLSKGMKAYVDSFDNRIPLYVRIALVDLEEHDQYYGLETVRVIFNYIKDLLHNV